MHHSVSRPRLVFFRIARRAAMSRNSRMRISGSSVCCADPWSTISGELFPYLVPMRAVLTFVRNFLAAETLTLVHSLPNNAPGIDLEASKCWVVGSPMGKCPMRRQHGTAASIRFVSVVPLRRNVVSTCAPSERPSCTTGILWETCRM